MIRRRNRNLRSENRRSLKASADRNGQHHKLRWFLKPHVCFVLVLLLFVTIRNTVTIDSLFLKDCSEFSETKVDSGLWKVDPTISFTSKRKLVHVISPYVEVIQSHAKNPHQKGNRTMLDSRDQRPSDDQNRSTVPMSVEQITVLLSLQRARKVFYHHLLDEQRWSTEQKTRPDRTNDKAKQETPMSSSSMEYSAFQKVELVCAVLPEDSSPLKSILQRICDRTVPLPQRSTKTQYGVNRSIPFLQDILEISQEASRADNSTMQSLLQRQDDDNFYLFSNADIGLSQSFYLQLETQLQNRKASALSINRMTLDVKTTSDATDSIQATANGPTDPLTMSWDAALRYLKQANDLIAANQYQPHPGYDCFLFHSSVLKRIHFGDFFVGFPPFGANIHLALSIMAPNYANLASNPNGTFHLGNARHWLTSDSKAMVKEKASGQSSNESKQQSITDSYVYWARYREDLDYLPWCPVSNHPPPNDYAMQNSINCGKWFRPNRRWPPRHKSTWWPSWQSSESSFPIPAFVQEGSEAVYLRNFGKYLNYTKDGMPLVPGHQTPEIKRRYPKGVKEGKISRLLQTISSFSNYNRI